MLSAIVPPCIEASFHRSRNVMIRCNGVVRTGGLHLSTRMKTGTSRPNKSRDVPMFSEDGLADADRAEVGGGGLLVECGDIRADELVEGVDLLVDLFGQFSVDGFGGVGWAVVAEGDRAGQAGKLGPQADTGVVGVSPTGAKIGHEQSFLDFEHLLL